MRTLAATLFLLPGLVSLMALPVAAQVVEQSYSLVWKNPQWASRVGIVIPPPRPDPPTVDLHGKPIAPPMATREGAAPSQRAVIDGVRFYFGQDEPEGLSMTGGPVTSGMIHVKPPGAATFGSSGARCAASLVGAMEVLAAQAKAGGANAVISTGDSLALSHDTFICMGGGVMLSGVAAKVQPKT